MLRIELVLWALNIPIARCKYMLCKKQATVIVKDRGAIGVKLVFCAEHTIEYLKKASRVDEPCSVELYIYRGISAEERGMLRSFLLEHGVELETIR